MDKFLQVIYSEYAPSSKNYMWVNSNDGLIYVFHEGKWKELSSGGSIDVKDVVASGTAEDRNRLPNPNDGMLFMQRDNTGYNKLFIYKNNTWSEFVPDVDSHDLFHICSASEYNPETLVPTVASPKDNTFYLVPSGDDNDIYKEWIYVDDAWELFGSAKVSPQSQVIVATCSTIPDLGNPSVWFFYKPEDVSFSNTGVQTLRNPMNATEFISWMNSNRVKFTQAPPRLRLLCYATIQDWEGGGAYYTLTHFYNNNDLGFSIVNCKDKNYCVLYGFGYDSVNGWYSKKTQYPVELWIAASVDDQTVFSCDALDLHNLTPKQLGQHLYDNYTDYTTTKTFALNYVGHLLTGILTKDTDTQKLQWEAEILYDQVTISPESGIGEVDEEIRETFIILYDANDDTNCIFTRIAFQPIDKGEVTYYYFGAVDDPQASSTIYLKPQRNGSFTPMTYQQFIDELYNNRAEINQRNAQLIFTTNSTPTLSQAIRKFDTILFQAETDSGNHEFVQVEFNSVGDNVMPMNENDRTITYSSLFFKKQWDTTNNQYTYIANIATRELGEFVEVQSSLPSSLTSKDLGHYCIVDDTIYKVVQDGSNYVWEKQIPPTDTIDKGELIYYVTKDIIDETSSNYENPASTTYYKPQLYDAEPLSFDLTGFLRDVFRNGRQGMELNARRGAKLIVEFLPRKNSNYSENQKIFHLAYVRQFPFSTSTVDWIISFQGLNYTIDTESASEKINYEIVNIEYKFRTPLTGAIINPSVTVTRTRIPSTNYIETQASLPAGLTAEDLNRHCIVDNQLYKVVQSGSDYVWQKIKNLYSNVILFGYGSWIMTDEHGVEISGFDWRKPDGSTITWDEVSTYIFNEIEARQTHTTAMSGLPQEAKGWQVQESLYICMQDTSRNTYNLMFELQSVFFNGSKGWSATCLERSIEANSSVFERSITQTFHMFYEPTYAPDGRLTKDVIYGDVMVANDLPDPRDIHLGKCAIVGNKLYKCSYVSGSYQWVEVPIGKDNVIIDVTTLPTTDIQTESLYRVAGQVFYEGTDVTEFGLYKFTEHGIELGCVADANSITVLDGVNQPITYSWENFNAVDIHNNMSYSHSIEKTHDPTEADFALIDTLPQSPGTSKTNIARHISVCEIIPSKLYHYKDNAWIQIQPTTDTALTTTDKTIVGAINEISSNIHIPIIDVNSLPSTNIDTNALYRVVGQVLYEGTDVTSYPFFKITQVGADAGCTANGLYIQIPNGTTTTTRTWQQFSADELTSLFSSNYVEIAFTRSESDFGLITTDESVTQGMARHNDSFTFIYELYHYVNNAWQQLQHTSAPSLTTTDKTIVGSINELNANKAPYSSLKHVGSTSLNADLLWDISEPASTEMRVKIASDNIEPIGVRGYGTMIIMERRAGTGNESQVFLEFYANRDSDNTPLQPPFNKYVKMGILPAEHNGAFSTQFSNITWSEWMRVEQGEHNTLNASVVTNVNNCIFQLVGVRGTRYFRDSKLYYAYMTNPLSNTNIYGECLTEEMNQSNKLYITQTFKQYTTKNTSQVVFKRQGYYTYTTEAGDWLVIEEGDPEGTLPHQPTIVWGAWFPVEYPATSIYLNDGWNGSIIIDVTGGILTLHILNLIKTSTATSKLPINSSSALGTGLIALPIKYVVWMTIYKTDDMSLANTVWRQNEGLTISTNIVQDAQYLGTLQIPLGY